MASTTTPRTSSELVALMDGGWATFEAAARAVGEDGLDRRTAAGWTRKEMLAHVGAWHELARRRLRSFRQTGSTEPGGGDPAARFDGLGLSDAVRERLLAAWDMDAFNAGIRDAATARPAADVLRELRESYARLRAEVTALSDEQVTAPLSEGRPFAVAVVEGDTYGHYPEHLDELEERGA